MKKLDFLPLLRRLALFVVFFGILTLPYTVQLLKEIGSGASVYQSRTNGISLDGLVVPPPKGTFYNMLMERPERNLSPGHFFRVPARMAFLRYSVIILLLYSSCVIVRRKRAAVFWFAIAAFYFLLSLGPRLTISSSLAFDIPMPYDLMCFIIPPLRIARVTGDYLLHFTLAAAIMCSIGLGAISERISSVRKNRCVFTLIAVIIIVESLVIPLDLVAPKVTMAYGKIKDDPSEFTVAEFPIDNFLFLSRQFLFQTYHRKKLLGGLAVRPSPGVREFLDNPFIKCAEKPRAFFRSNPLWMGETLHKNRLFLEWTNLKYVVVNKKAFRIFRTDYDIFMPGLEQYLNLNGFVKTYEDEDESLFQKDDGKFDALERTQSTARE